MNLTTKSFIVMEYPTKQIITGSYFRQVCEIASLTKTITFYCCLLLVEKYDINIDEEILVIDQQVESITGTSAELLEGDMFTFRQICYGLMLPSGNDAALAMAQWGGRVIKKWNQS
jgi:D-alanyl-D-alanine carboxypeptidase (penicillin-binding protein 5/6)